MKMTTTGVKEVVDRGGCIEMDWSCSAIACTSGCAAADAVCGQVKISWHSGRGEQGQVERVGLVFQITKNVFALLTSLGKLNAAVFQLFIAFT